MAPKAKLRRKPVPSKPAAPAASPAKAPEADIIPSRGFRELYRAFLAHHPEIAGTIKTFNDNKRPIPAVPLPEKMKDHKLKDRLKEYRECHLADDVLLIYKHTGNVVKMLYICQHDDLRGGREKSLAKTLKNLDS